MFRIIVNADDYGIDKQASLAIASLFDAGLIDRTTMIVNSSDLKQYVDKARAGHFLNKVGLHVNIYEGKPLTKEICDFPRFVSNGYFNHNYRKTIFGRLFISKKEQHALFLELDAQFKRFVDLMGADCLRHFDSHHHVHIDYSVWKVIKKAALMNGFTSVRLSQNIFSTNKKIGLFKLLYKFLLNKNIKKHFSTSNYFSSTKEFFNTTKKKHERIKNSDAVLELMCHPKYNDDASYLDPEEICLLRRINEEFKK